MALVNRTNISPTESTAADYSDNSRRKMPLAGNSGSSVPHWFEVAAFQYNVRIIIGFIPGILLLGVVLGKTFFAVLLFCSMIILLCHSLGYNMPTLIGTVVTVLVCQVTNVYLMTPLIWHSLLNIPMFLLLHLFIAICGTWGLLQNIEFLKQDPRIVLFVEQGLFLLLPALDIAMVGWVSGMLWGKEYLPPIIALTGVFIIPLKSSFAKQGIPQHTGLILSQPIALSYMLVSLFLPGILNAALDHRYIFTSAVVFVKYQAYFVCPIFVLSLFEAQGIFHWLGTGATERLIRGLRLVSGSVLMGLLFFLVYSLPSSSVLPSLAVILLFGMLALVTTLDIDHTHLPLSSLILGGIVSVLYFVSSFEIRWTISYNFSLLAIPYYIVQLLLLSLGILSVIMLLGWRRDLTLLWPTYHAVFVGCEFILHKEDLYSLPLLLSTAATAILLCLRLNSIGRLPLPLTIMCVSLHIMKLSQLLPYNITIMDIPLLSITGTILVGIGLMILSSTHKQSLLMFLLCSVIIIIGLSLCVDSFLSPLLTAITHTPPTGADLATITLLTSGYIIQQHITVISYSKYYQLVAKIPASFFIMAMLIWAIKPDFNLIEIAKAVAMVAVHHADINSFMGQLITSDQLSLMAWLLIVKWIVVFYAGLTIATIILSNVITIIPFFAAVWLLGSGFGMLSLIVLSHYTPLSILSLFYILYGGTISLLMAVITYREMIKHKHFAVTSLFCVLLVTVAMVLSWEWSMPLVAGIVHIPSTLFFVSGFFLLSLTIKIKSLMKRGIPTNPIICNISCLLAFLLAISFPLPFKLDHTLLISVSSCVMLLAQPDGYTIPKRPGLFLAPVLLASSCALFLVILIDTLTAKLTTGYIIQLICLITSIPGQLKLITNLWRDVPLKFSIISFTLYVAPNACLAQFGGNPNVVYGSTAVLCFSLLVMAEFQTLKTI